MNSHEVAIAGIGLLSTQEAGIDSVWKSLNEVSPTNEKKAQAAGSARNEFEFAPGLPASELRRVNRYSRLALAGALEAKKDAASDLDDIPAFRRGSIFTTGYGSLVSNVKFSESVMKGDPDSCSPTLFASTVANACVGQVCMQLNLKGVSTVLMGGDVFTFAKLMLDTNRADIFFAGALEEYCRDLWDSLDKNEAASGAAINEASVVFVLKRIHGDSCGVYCTLGAGASAGLDGFPLVKKLDAEASVQVMRSVLRDCAEKNGGREKIDVIFSSANDSYFDDIEATAIAKELPNAFPVTGVKGFFGETLGCAFSLNVAVAALCLKKMYIPSSLSPGASFDADFQNILVTGLDPVGNYHSLMLRRPE